MGNGLFIAIEGSAGAGTAAQLNLLKERLRAVGYEVASFEFPSSLQDSGYFVRSYLTGQFGAAGDISPYTASLFYVMDHYAAAKKIRAALDEDKIVIATGYAGSVMAQQAAKFTDDIEKRSFFIWADNLAFQLLDLPRPNLNFFLRLPADISYSKTAKSKSQLSKGRLKSVLAAYDLLCRLFPKDFKAIESSKNSKPLDVPVVNNLIWEKLKPLLPAKKAHASHSVVVTLGNDVEPETPGQDSGEAELKHDFKDGSLLLRLTLQRLVPEGTSHSFDGWQEGNYRFYAASRLPKDARDKYQRHAEQLSILHQQLSKKMTGYMQRDGNKQSYSAAQLLQPLTPLGALSDFTLTIKKTRVIKTAACLLASDSDELQWAAKQLYLAARKKWPKDFSQPLESHSGPAALSNIIAKIADQRLQAYSADEAIKLLEARPRLEFDLLAESVFPFSSLSSDEISEEISDWPYSQKYQSLKEAAGQSDVLAKVTYKLDVLSDHLTLDKIIQTAGLSDVQTQAFTPRYGYDMPRLVDAAGADDLYDAAFDESLAFYGLLQSIGRDDLTPYATLLGHKLRWQLNASAANLKPVFQDSGLMQNPTIKAVSEKLSEAHPILWEVITSGDVLPPASEPKGKARVKSSGRRRGGKSKKS